MEKHNVRSTALKTVAWAILASAATVSAAEAGGFDVREQSAYYQGMSFAGSAAGSSLSSMFWNPAAAGLVGKGLSFESSYSLIIPDSELTVDSVSGLGNPLTGIENGKDKTVDIGRTAVVPATYAAWRGDIEPRLVFALSLNSQYGLGTKPDNVGWAGEIWARSAKIFSINASPTVAYEISKGLTVAAGMQFQYFDLKHFKIANPSTGFASNSFDGSDLGVGFTLGVIVTPAQGTKIGVGYRSQIDHDLTGGTVSEATGISAPIAAKLTTPDKITASFEQVVTSTLRLNGTVEWTNWSTMGVIPITVTLNNTVPAVLDLQWHDGWMFALGGEYDYSNKLTLRAGGAYELSPIQNPSERLLQLPDADRIWASVGASYKWNEAFTFDIAYSHIFVEDSQFSRHPSTVALSTGLITGSAESSVDIISLGVKSKW